MNRYRTVPGFGPQKAGANTVCQKCLKKDIYECKSAIQERPYASRPSRTQQLSNPRLMPKLAADTPNDLLNSKGIADQQLAEASARRLGPITSPEDRNPRTDSMPVEHSDSDSVSTISTNRSQSPPRSNARGRKGRDGADGRTYQQRSRTPDVPRKRKHRSLSTISSHSSRSTRREPGSYRKSRRHRTTSPKDRGRMSSMRRGSHRSGSGSSSVDKSQVTKHRRSLGNGDDHGHRRLDPDRVVNNEDRPLPGSDFRYGRETDRTGRRERSLSPYSKRLALTQAMNM